MRSGTHLRSDLVASFFQFADGSIGVLLTDEEVVCFVGGDDEDADPGLGETSGKIGDDAYQRKVQRSDDAKATPVAFRFDVLGYAVFAAYDRQLVVSSRGRSEFTV